MHVFYCILLYYIISYYIVLYCDVITIVLCTMGNKYNGNNDTGNVHDGNLTARQWKYNGNIMYWEYSKMGCQTIVKQPHYIPIVILIDQKKDAKCRKSAAIQSFPAHSAIPKSTSTRKY